MSTISRILGKRLESTTTCAIPAVDVPFGASFPRTLMARPERKKERKRSEVRKVPPITEETEPDVHDLESWAKENYPKVVSAVSPLAESTKAQLYLTLWNDRGTNKPLVESAPSQDTSTPKTEEPLIPAEAKRVNPEAGDLCQQQAPSKGAEPAPIPTMRGGDEVLSMFGIQESSYSTNADMPDEQQQRAMFGMVAEAM